MIVAWFTSRGLLGLRKGVWLLIALAGCVALWLAFTGMLDRLEDGAETRGAAVQRETDLTETINRVEQGNEARQEIERETMRGGGNAIYAQCLRSARNPEQCARYLLPERADD